MSLKATYKREVCLWAENSDGIWDTACGNAFEFDSGGPTENGGYEG